MAKTDALSNEVVDFLKESAHDGSALAAFALGQHFKATKLYKESLLWLNLAAKDKQTVSKARREIDSIAGQGDVMYIN